MGWKFVLIVVVLLGWSVGVFAGDVNEKVGVYVTPNGKEEGVYPVTYEHALETLKGAAKTVWVLEAWRNVEKEDGVYDWGSLDRRVDGAVKAGFDVGIRLQIVLCGNNAKHEFVAAPVVPAYLKGGMMAEDFSERAARFFGELAKRYKGKARYIAVGNSVNNYFERHGDQWEAFKKAYGGIVRAIHGADAGVKVLADVSSGEDFFTDKAKFAKYLDFFGASGDDGVGFVFYFIVKVYYGEFENFTAKRLGEVLDDLHGRCGGKKIYIIETACFSTNPKTGKDMSEVQARYVEMLLKAVVEKEWILGVSWWQLYDARDEAGVPWDVRASFGLFDAAGKGKAGWEAWKKCCVLK